MWIASCPLEKLTILVNCSARFPVRSALTSSRGSSLEVVFRSACTVLSNIDHRPSVNVYVCPVLAVCIVVLHKNGWNGSGVVSCEMMGELGKSETNCFWSTVLANCFTPAAKQKYPIAHRRIYLATRCLCLLSRYRMNQPITIAHIPKSTTKILSRLVVTPLRGRNRLMP